VTDLPGTVAGQLAEEPQSVRKLLPGSITQNSFVFRVREHHVPLLRELTDIDVPGAQCQRSRHRLLLVLERRARQVQVHLVPAGPRLLGRLEPDPEARVIARKKCDAGMLVGLVGELPAQDPAPEAREPERVGRIPS
jgi:hypothetical protein